MKSLKEQLINEESISTLMSGDSNLKVKLPKNTVILAVYSTSGEDLMIWAPEDEDELAELLMRNFDYDYDAKKTAKLILNLNSGDTSSIMLTPKKGSKTKINFTAIK